MAATFADSMCNAIPKLLLWNSRLSASINRCLFRGEIVSKEICSHKKNLYSSTTSSRFQQTATAAGEVKDPSSPEQSSLEHEDYFRVRSLVSLKDLYSARVHLGHKAGVRNVYMSPYIFGCRQDVDILDLDQTLVRLQDAMNFTAHIVYRGGIVLILSRHNQTLPLVEKMAEDCGEYSHCRPWKRSTFTDSTVMFGSETRLPDLCVFLSTIDNGFEEHRALTEASKMLIPSVAVVDTNCDPRLVTYPVPGNDDSPTAISLYCSLFKEAILRGKAKRKEDGLDAENE